MHRYERPGRTAARTFIGLLLVTILAVGCAATNSQGPGTSAPGSYQVVAIGPGDVDLITPRALAAIGRAHIVFCELRQREQLEALVRFDGKQVLAGYGVIFPYYGRDCATVPADQPSRWSMSCEQFQEKQADFQARVRGAVAAGQHVVLLSGGDPTIYGPAMWSLHALADLNPTVVPGISAFNAANATLQVRLGEVANPARLTAGAELPVRVMFRGQPMAQMPVRAVFAGYAETASKDKPYVVEAITDAKGETILVLDRAAYWLISLSHTIAHPEPELCDDDRYNTALTLQVR